MNPSIYLQNARKVKELCTHRFTWYDDPGIRSRSLKDRSIQSTRQQLILEANCIHLQ